MVRFTVRKTSLQTQVSQLRSQALTTSVVVVSVVVVAVRVAVVSAARTSSIILLDKRGQSFPGLLFFRVYCKF